MILHFLIEHGEHGLSNLHKALVIFLLGNHEWHDLDEFHEYGEEPIRGIRSFVRFVMERTDKSIPKITQTSDFCKNLAGYPVPTHASSKSARSMSLVVGGMA